MSRDLRVTARQTGMQRGELLAGLQQHGAHCVGKPRVFGQLRQCRQEPIRRAPDDDTEFGEQPPHPVQQRGAFFLPALAHTVPSQKGLLIDGLDRNEAHRWLPSSDGDGLRIRGVILATFPERHDKFGSDQQSGVAMRGKPAAPMMSRSARLHRHLARRQLFCPSLERATAENATFNNRTVHIEHACRNHILCEIKADRSKLFHDFPSCSD